MLTVCGRQSQRMVNHPSFQTFAISTPQSQNFSNFNQSLDISCPNREEHANFSQSASVSQWSQSGSLDFELPRPRLLNFIPLLRCAASGREAVEKLKILCHDTIEIRCESFEIWVRGVLRFAKGRKSFEIRVWGVLKKLQKGLLPQFKRRCSSRGVPKVGGAEGDLFERKLRNIKTLYAFAYLY